MPITQCEVRPGAYYDSVVLMQLQRSLAELPGIKDAGVVMATPANRELLAASELQVDKPAGADDLLIVVKAENDLAARDALEQVDGLLARRLSRTSQEFRPRSLEMATKQLPEADWVLVSVPGRYAAGVAREGLRLNKHVFVYSDNVSLEDEIALKKEARERGLLVMGPDCGTAIINGVGLGFANRVRRGSIGLVGASGTGLQAITSRIHNLGAGVSQAIGTGGRDLKAEVGAITANQGLDLLVRDPQTKVIVLISKPPEPQIASQLLASAQNSGKLVVIDFIGYTPPARQLGNLHFAADLSDAAGLAVGLLENFENDRMSGGSNLEPGRQGQGYLRGLFSGGTLAYEALLGFQTLLTPIFTNIPVDESQRLADVFTSQAHTIVDLGEDEFTQGRLHPMMDNDLRLRRLRQEAADPDVGVILLDVVLGEGAHPDPASELAPVIHEVIETASRSGRMLSVVAIVVGTDEDPQDLSSQVDKLIEAGAVVFRDTMAAIEYIGRKLSQRKPFQGSEVDLERFHAPLAAINVGLEIFQESLKGQGVDVVQVEWRPPAGGDDKLMALLAKMKSA